MLSRVSFFISVLFLFLVKTSYAITIDFKNLNEVSPIGENVGFYEDKGNEMKIFEVAKLNNFKNSDKDILNFGISNSTFWIKLKIKNKTPHSPILLEVAQPLLDKSELYSPIDSNKFLVKKLGEGKPFSKRYFDYTNYLYELNIPQDSLVTFYLKIKSSEQLLIPLFLGSEKVIIKKLNNKDIFFGIYFGIIIVMILYNFFIFLSIRDSIYLYYVVYVFFVGFTQLCAQGYTFKYFWPNNEWLASHSIFLATSLVGIAAIEFVKRFLNTKKKNPRLHKGFHVFSSVYLACFLISIIETNNFIYFLIDINAIGIALYMMYVAIRMFMSGSREAKFFLIAWTIFLVGVCTYILKDFGVLPYNNFTFYLMPLGSAVETILLSFALADRINILKKANELKQNEIINHLKAKEQYLLAWKEVSINAEKLKKEKIEIQYESLKNQVNPHFLFNSLNVLTELLYQDQDQAAEFVKELSQVYRYVLENKDKEMVDLRTELNFVEAFIFLLKIRFDKSLIVNINLSPDSKVKIAPLTLQLLIENAIKHNVVSSENPLKIDLYEEDYFLVVSNNIQKKSSIERSSGIGLKNIQARYGFLTSRKVEIITDLSSYTVKIPKIFVEELVNE